MQSFFLIEICKYSHAQWLFYELISNFTNKLVKQSLSMTVRNRYIIAKITRVNSN